MKKTLFIILACCFIVKGYCQTSLEYYNSGSDKFDHSDYMGALADQNKSIELNPKFAPAYNNRGNARAKLRDYAGAITDFNIAIKLNPKNKDAFYNKGNAEYAINDYEKATANYNKAIQLDPMYGLAYSNRGLVKAEVKDYRGAISDFNKAIEIIPNDEADYYNRGGVKIMLGQKESGCIDFSKAGELGSEKAYQAIQKFCSTNNQTSSTNTPTKQETEQWILEKLRNNIQELEENQTRGLTDPPGWSIRNYKYQFSFDDENLVIEFVERLVTPRQTNYIYEFDAKESNIKILIPIYDIDMVKKIRETTVLIPSKRWATCDQIEIQVSTSSIKYFENDFEDFKRKSVMLNLSKEVDENLPTRLQKALLNLKTYYPKKQKILRKEAY